ncbi:MAG TPA: hypothetical protein VFD03_02475, partial [Clostridia bacterium]|nr:hypothetical protein [Clostridia bacterium]
YNMSSMNSMSPDNLIILIAILTIIISKGRDADDLNLIGSIISALGSNISTVAAQKQFNESFNAVNNTDNNQNSNNDNSENVDNSDNKNSDIGFSNIQEQLTALQKKIDDLENEIKTQLNVSCE